MLGLGRGWGTSWFVVVGEESDGEGGRSVVKHSRAEKVKGE